MKCKNCNKEKDKHVDNRWCYKTHNEMASSADWSEYAVSLEGGKND